MADKLSETVVSTFTQVVRLVLAIKSFVVYVPSCSLVDRWDTANPQS